MKIKWLDGSARLDPEDGHGYIATVRLRPTKTNNIAEMHNAARRFAASDDMLTTLQALVSELEPLAARKSTRYAPLHWALETARSTIAKAEGRA